MFANFLIIVLQCTWEIVTTFGSKMVTIFAFNTMRIEKICKLSKAISFFIINIFQPNFGTLLLLKGSFWEFRFYCLYEKPIMQIVHAFVSDIWPNQKLT